jgi:hypothetical protein
MDKRWLAGFFDGEGCVHLQARFRKDRKAANYSLQVCITQNDKDILDEICREYGGQVYQHSGRVCYRWRICSLRSLRFLNDILPYVRIKKGQVELAIKFCKTIRQENLGSTSLGIEVNAQRVLIRNRLKELNSVGSGKIPETAGTPERAICNEASKEERSETIMGTPRGEGIVRHSKELEITDRYGHEVA